MPCAKGMTGCARTCLHRALVDEYRLARYAAERERDDRTHMGRGELEMGDECLITFKDWIRGLAQAYPIGYGE